MARVKAKHIKITWVTMRMLLLFKRSARMPPKRLRIRMGIEPKKPTRPKSKTEFVNKISTYTAGKITSVDVSSVTPVFDVKRASFLSKGGTAEIRSSIVNDVIYIPNVDVWKDITFHRIITNPIFYFQNLDTSATLYYFIEGVK